MMLGQIRKFFEQQIKAADAAVGEHEVHLAAAMLLLEVTRADFEVQSEELVQVAEILQGQFGFSDEETAELVELATRRSDESHSLHPYLRLINERYTQEQKVKVIEDLWRVAYADHRLDKYEEYQVRKIADLLYVPHVAFIQAKHRVLAATEAQKEKGA